MPRTARKMSSTGYMHVIAKGNGGQILFEGPEDYCRYLLLLQKQCLETGVKIGAFCLMENHVHLLTYSDGDSLMHMMRKLGVSYAEYFNHKYERTGHLFNNRYKSEPIEDDRYLVTVFRYILLNPQKAGVHKASDYTWSSYKLYDNPPDFMNLDLIRDLVGDFNDYKKFIENENNDKCLDCNLYFHSDNWAIKEIRSRFGVSSCTELQSYDKKARDDAIGVLKKSGLSVRQIERLTGLNRGIIQRVK